MITLPTYYWDVDFRQNQLIRAALEKLESHPSDPKLGRIYFNTTEDKIYYRITDKWVVIGGINKISNTDGSIIVTGDNEDIVLNINLDNTTLGLNALGEIHLLDDSVNTQHLKDDSVSTVKIKNKNITFNKIQDIPAMTVIGNVQNSDGSPQAISIISDINNSSNSSLITSEGVKLFVEDYFSKLGTFRGEFDPTLNTYPQETDIVSGDYWFISKEGIFKGEEVRPGDQILSNIDSPTSDQDFTLIQSTYSEATETTLGLVMLATDQEAIDSSNDKVITTKNLIAKTASNIEAGEGVIDNKFLTPKSLKYVLDQHTLNSKYIQTFGDGVTTTFTFEHNFGTKFVNHVIFTSNNENVYSSPIRFDDKLTFTFVKPIDLNDYNIAIWT